MLTSYYKRINKNNITFKYGLPKLGLQEVAIIKVIGQNQNYMLEGINILNYLQSEVRKMCYFILTGVEGLETTSYKEFENKTNFYVEITIKPYKIKHYGHKKVIFDEYFKNLL